MFYEFLTPIDTELIFGEAIFHPNQIGSHIKIYGGTEVELHDFHIALIGVMDDRNTLLNEGCATAATELRQQLYSLYLPSKHEFKVLDLGNILPGASSRDTYFALASVVLKLVTHKVIPIIVGGGHDLTYGQYLGYQDLQGMINVVNVDEKIDMGSSPEEPIHAGSFIMRMLTHQPNYLFNYSHLGYQTYLNDPAAMDTLESLNFDCHRLGILQHSIDEIEPIMRDANMVSIDMSCLRMSDFPAHAQASPHGFYGEELCQITRYAGLSDKVSSIGFYEMNPRYDKDEQSTQLLAHAVWYFIEGYYNRKNDIPTESSDYIRFVVKLEEVDHELIFWKSKLTDRWWMELPYQANSKFDRNQYLVPCTYADYEMACKEELPDRWMKVFTRLA
jgi:arginase family enzyme